jgi:hypothetical protein
MENNIHKIGKELFITSDEEIKIGTWILDNILANKKPIKVTKELLEDGLLKEDKKIILTTDLELQKEGVQAIDDEFLEWFVKNPSCAEVKILRCPIEGLYTIDLSELIPKEEPKQETTLEEAAERLYPLRNTFLERFKDLEQKIFIEGAKWLQKEMLEFILDEDNHTEGELGNSCIDVQTLVNHLKKK